ncbi:MAG TPA: DUF1549 domain-containing protein [Pirellulales bacterium]|nr:DUF1549 domain-containing protein [Pirellulales bacterium]
MHPILAFACLVSLSAASAAGEEVARPANERFASESSSQPEFRRHVLPVMGRLGCNGRACHDSFQGRGGFRLSLFGYDFAADHEAMTGGEQPRANVKDPAASLLLQKPTLQVDHEGDKRMEVESWQYNILRRWIEAGAAGVKTEDAEFETLHVEPREIVAQQPGEGPQLRVTARWSDGACEDVTPLCRFRSNDESIATIDENGRVTVVGKGDTDVVAFYDNGVVTVPVMAPVSDLAGEKYPPVPAPTKIDELVVAKLRKLGIVPSDVCTDEEFLRRTSLDATGSLPLADEVTAFLADSSSDKRTRKIDELLARPTYAAWWATKLCDVTGDNEQNAGERRFRRQQAEQWYQWIYRRVEQNVPYDKIVEGIVLATGRQAGQSYEEYAAETTAYYRPDQPADFAARETMPHFWARRQFNQAKDKALAFSYAFLGVRLQCAECHKHPFDQWTKQDFEQFSAFFDRVAYGYAPDAKQAVKTMEEGLNLKKIKDKDAAKLIADGKVLPWNEVYLRDPNQRGGKERRDKAVKKQGRPAGRVITPKLLGGDEVVAEQYSDPREALMEWMRSDDNPYFARAWVNRVWASYFNVGIIEPPDDMNLANPPSNEPLLAYLTRSFVEHGYDMKWLHREILNSRTYQLSWRDNDTNRLDTRNFSHAIIRRLPAEVAYDALVQATAATGRVEQARDDLAERAIGVSSSYTGLKRGGNYVLSLFGKPERATNCDCERSNEPSLLQTIYLRNDQSMLSLLERGDGWLKQIDPTANRQRKGLEEQQAKLAETISQLELRLKEVQGDDAAKRAKTIGRELAGLQKRAAQVARALEDEKRRNAKRGNAEIAPVEITPVEASPEQLVREAYLRTLSRLPKQDEQEVALRYVNESETPAAGMKDLMWALLNTKEFIVNR